MTASVLLTRQGSTLVITLNKPERRNAFDLDMRRALADVTEQLARRVVHRCHRAAQVRHRQVVDR